MTKRVVTWSTYLVDFSHDARNIIVFIVAIWINNESMYAIVKKTFQKEGDLSLKNNRSYSSVNAGHDMQRNISCPCL
jgi:hypothetical protein